MKLTFDDVWELVVIVLVLLVGHVRDDLEALLLFVTLFLNLIVLIRFCLHIH